MAEEPEENGVRDEEELAAWIDHEFPDHAVPHIEVVKALLSKAHLGWCPFSGELEVNLYSIEWDDNPFHPSALLLRDSLDEDATAGVGGEGAERDMDADFRPLLEKLKARLSGWQRLVDEMLALPDGKEPSDG